jgi:hypothetical protein
MSPWLVQPQDSIVFTVSEEHQPSSSSLPSARGPEVPCLVFVQSVPPVWNLPFSKETSYFYIAWQNTCQKQLKGRKIYLAHSFRGFSLWLLGHTCLGRTKHGRVREKEMVKGRWLKYLICTYENGIMNFIKIVLKGGKGVLERVMEGVNLIKVH